MMGVAELAPRCENGHVAESGGGGSHDPFRMHTGHDMQHAYVWLLSLILIGSLPGYSLWAQSVGALGHSSLSLASPGRSVIEPGQRSRYLPIMPYPYPRIYVSPYISLDPYAPPETYRPRRPSAAAPQGFLRLEVKPSDAEIYVDGNFIGRGRDFPGPALVSVWPGGHLVEFRFQGSGNHIRLFVAAGETVQASRDLSPITSDAVRPPAKRWSTPSSQ